MINYNTIVDTTLVAAGSTQADATEIRATVAVPTAASTDGTKGVRLPAGVAAGETVFVKNIAGSAVALKVYSAASTGFINATAGSTAYSLAQNKSALFVNLGSDNWITLLTA